MATMKHNTYSAITNTYNGKFVDKIKLEFNQEAMESDWYVTEKIHGANYSFWVDLYKTQSYAFVRCAKRSGFIEKEEKFYGHEAVHGALSKNMYELAMHMETDIIIYGELFGGSYNGKSKGAIVQKEVQYHPNTMFMAFDIALYNYGNPTYIPHEKFVELCEQFNIPYAPVLFKGTLSECIDYTNEFETTIPAQFGLEPIAGNVCEGVVIKPNKPLFLKSGERVILKNKNDKFNENKGVTTKVTNPSVLSGTLLQLLGLISQGLTENRMDAIMSKHGEELEFSNAMRLLFNDSAEENCKEEFAKLTKEEIGSIYKFLAKQLANVVKRKIVIKKVG